MYLESVKVGKSVKVDDYALIDLEEFGKDYVKQINKLKYDSVIYCCPNFYIGISKLILSMSGAKKSKDEILTNFIKERESFENKKDYRKQYFIERSAIIVNAKTLVGKTYLIKAEGTDMYKIGYSFNVDSRKYGMDTDCPHETTIVNFVESSIPTSIESFLHKRFKKNRSKREWFKFDETEIKEVNRVYNLLK